MGTFDQTSGLGFGAPITGLRTHLYSNVIDMNEAADGNAPVADDIIKVLKVPKGSLVKSFGLVVLEPGAGTAIVYTFGVTESRGATIAGTATIVDSSTPMAAGKIAPATVTTGLVDAKATEDADEDVYLTVTMTTLTAATDLGKFKFYAEVVDLN